MIKMKSFASLSSVHWLLQGFALVVCVSGQSLHFTSNIAESHKLRVESGQPATIQCILESSLQDNVNFTWTGPALDNCTMGHASIGRDRLGTISTLTINSVSKADAGQYSCSYAGARICVQLIVEYDPSFLDVNTSQTFTEGEDAVVKCPANFGNPPVSMEWTDDKYTFVTSLTESERFVPDNGSLTIQNIRIEDSGNYKCLFNHNPIIEMTIQVKVFPRREPPKINDTIRIFEVEYGDPLNLPCQVINNQENVTYMWTIDTEFEQDILQTTEATLHREVGKFVGGKYTCRAENEYGSDEIDFIVRINAAPLPRQCTSVETTTLTTSTAVVLKFCDLTSPVLPFGLTYTWTKNGAALTETQFNVNQYGLLTIQNVTHSDLGIYQVTISNAFGTAVHTVKLVAASHTSAAAVTQSQRSQDLLVPVVLKFTLSHAGKSNTRCTDVKEEIQGFIRRQILKDFSFADVAIKEVAVDCPFKSKRFGTFTATLRGSRARQLSTLIKSRGLSQFMLKNGQRVTVEECKSECSQEKSSTSKPWISKAGGVVITVTVTAVMLAGLALLIVILIRYRRRSFTKNGIDEEQLYLAPPTNLEKTFAKTKPAYYRSISVNLPITSSTLNNH